MVECFSHLEQGLRSHGLVEDARWLLGATTCAYTTSSEMYGTLGAMVQRIHRSIPFAAAQSLTAEFQRCEQVVQQVWPDFHLVPRST
jgi:hypothetical protein